MPYSCATCKAWAPANLFPACSQESCMDLPSQAEDPSLPLCSKGAAVSDRLELNTEAQAQSLITLPSHDYSIHFLSCNRILNIYVNVLLMF